MGIGLKSFILLSLVTGLVVQGQGCTGCCAGSSCPPFWTHYQGNCYRSFGSRVPWTEASRDCQRQGSELASVHSAGENAFIYELWRSGTDISCVYRIRGYWIGLSDVTTEGQFIYTDGSDVDFTNWLPNQPDDNGRNEDCGHIWYQNPSSDTVQGWNDWICNANTLLPYVCKMDAE